MTEGDRGLDLLAVPVGVAAGRRVAERHAAHFRRPVLAAVHLARRTARRRVVGHIRADRGVVLRHDRRAVQLQAGRWNAHAVAVEVVRLHTVAEAQVVLPRRVVCGPARRRADRQVQVRLAARRVHSDVLREEHANPNHFVPVVRAVACPQAAEHDLVHRRSLGFSSAGGHSSDRCQQAGDGETYPRSAAGRRAAYARDRPPHRCQQRLRLHQPS